MIIKLDILQTVALAVSVLYLGTFLKGKLNFLSKYCIPAPIVGGVLFATAAFALRMSGILSFEFDDTFLY